MGDLKIAYPRARLFVFFFSFPAMSEAKWLATVVGCRWHH